MLQQTSRYHQTRKKKMENSHTRMHMHEQGILKSKISQWKLQLRTERSRESANRRNVEKFPHGRVRECRRAKLAKP